MTVRGGITRHDETGIVHRPGNRLSNRRIAKRAKRLRHQYHFCTATTPAARRARQLQGGLVPPLIAVCESRGIENDIDFPIDVQAVAVTQPCRHQRGQVTEFHAPPLQG